MRQFFFIQTSQEDEAVMQVSQLSVLTSFKVEETEVEEGKWKEGARGAPR